MNTKKALHAGWIIPVRPKGQILEKHTLVIEDQKIKSILPTEDWKRRKKSRNMEELDLNSCALIPGFVNTHTHSPILTTKGSGGPTI
jgi:Cytosine deaminase and related metal-dependent hydrolases